MADFTGTNSDEIITPFFVSSTVTAVGGARPSNAADVIDGGAGNDVIDGGGGNDVLLGGDGNDLLIGGAGDDVVTGGKGSDVALLGAGDDVFIWNPGDGSDVVEGGAGTDTLVFNGNGNDEHFDISANGGRATLFRDVGTVTMDLNSVEKIELAASGGADTITVNDLTGSGVKQVAIDLAASGTTAGDGQPDTVIVNGTARNDHISIATSGTLVTVNGLSAQVTIDHAEGANDTLLVNGLAGNDTIDASALIAGQIKLTIDGGAGNDTIIGSAGNDVLIGGDGNDVVTGGKGNDVALLGAGDDVFIWNPGDGSDVVEGGAATDTLVFNGNGNDEHFDISANGSRATLFRDVGNVTMDLNSVEKIQLAAAGGVDTITVNDLTGTDVKQVAIDLAAAGTSHGDGQSDQVIINASNGSDFITIDSSGGVVKVSGLAETVTIAHAEGALDVLTINGLGGDDVIDASGLSANQIGLVLNGGDGNDVILGSHGDDAVNGGKGNDVAALGGGNDVFTWNPGDGSDTVDGQAGFDTLVFNGGANASENVNIFANGDQATFFRDVAAVTMHLNSIERIEFSAGGGADNITVNDLTGTGVKQVAIDFTPNDNVNGQADTVTVDGTVGNDHIDVTASGAVVTVSGLPAQVTIDRGEAGDFLSINGGADNDTIDASKMPAGTMALTLNGGDGNDTIIGGAGNDVLAGGSGNDTFVFNFGASGHDVIQDFQVHGASAQQGDVVRLEGGPDHTFAQAVADGHIAQSGADVVISDGTNVIATLQHISVADLHAHDFMFV